MSDTQQIKDKIDIVDFIGEYVQLKAAGINHKACCPFHQEKTPSFMVSRERHSFHCFGCGKGGDIFTFLQEMEGMEFVEALKHLADRAGIQLTRQPSKIHASQKNRIKEINTEAARFFYNFLIQMEAAQGAREYLDNRGLKEATIEEWQVGYVSNQWDLLTKYLLKKGHSIDDLIASGLTIKRDGIPSTSSPRHGLGPNAGQAGTGFYDRFRGRIMFPIWDIHGSAVGFTGRQLVPDGHSGKYVNTPQTLVYDKSRVVFGLNKSKQEIRQKDMVVMVEGQTDVISCHQAGMKNVVASSGTALTEGQVKLLNRYSKNMNMAFDADAAGEAAAKRGIELAVAAGMNVKVIQIPEGAGKDPDECVKENPKVWFEAVKEAKGVMEWYFDRAFEGKDISDPKQKQAVVHTLLPEINLIPYAVEKDHWFKELSARLGVEISVLREDMKRIAKKSDQRSVIRDQDKDKKGGAKPQDRFSLLTERLFVLILRFPNLIIDHWSLIADTLLSTGTYSSLYKAINEEYNKNNRLNVDRLREKLATDEAENIADVLLMKGELDFWNMKDDESRTEIEKTIAAINLEMVKKRRRELQREIEVAEKQGSEVKLQELMREFQKL